MPRPRRAGFSLIECVLATLIVGGLTVSALNLYGATAARRALAKDETAGRMLAADLMSEIAASDRTARRNIVRPSRFADPASYDGWSASPPQNQFGAAYDEWAGWTRSVAVDEVSPSDAQTPAAGSGVYRVTVTVSKGGKTRASLVRILTDEWTAADERGFDNADDLSGSDGASPRGRS